MMLNRLLSHPIVQTFAAAAVGMGILICILPQLVPSLSWVVNYAVLLMLFYLVAGMVFLFMKQPTLTFICFAGCALLCFFLKYSVKNDSIERWRQTVIKDRLPPPQEAAEVHIKAAHLNVTNSGDASEVLEALRKTRADLISIHEVTPDWGNLLRDSLAAVYPYHHDMVDIGLFGMSIYSHYELSDIDTFYYDEIPNLRGCVNVGEEGLCFISVHTEPALNSFALRRLREHLSTVADQVKIAQSPILVMGDFNAVPWSEEIQVFMDSSGLQESRTGFIPFSNGGTSSFFDLPLDHIFFSPRLHCLNFEVLNNKASRHLGIMGDYQVKPLANHAKKTAQ
ncbi:MAG: endonuclease/exonuclease/phosphatase family protein [Saprospiraceae bacterium]